MERFRQQKNYKTYLSTQMAERIEKLHLPAMNTDEAQLNRKFLDTGKFSEIERRLQTVVRPVVSSKKFGLKQHQDTKGLISLQF